MGLFVYSESMIKGFAVADRTKRGGQYVGAWRVLAPSIDYEKCTGCMLCAMYCPEAAIVAGEEKKPRVDLRFCKGCGVCANECPAKAVAMVKEER
jgi:pyruvate ferredoxin oxidoreductase delta subunit